MSYAVIFGLAIAIWAFMLSRPRGPWQRQKQPPHPLQPVRTHTPPPPPRRTPPVMAPTRPISGRVIDLSGQDLRTFESHPAADISINLQDCQNLTALPDSISTGSLNLSGCVALQRLPASLNVTFLDLADCSALAELPPNLRLRAGRLNLRNCMRLMQLPPGLGEVAQLDLSGCLNIVEIPDDLTVTSWIDVGGSGITGLPPHLDDVGIRWNGIAVSRRVAFNPETLSHTEILGERNAEIRRVMIERFGYERLFEKAGAEELDRDRDAGGERRLLRVEIPNDEALVCVSVRCPSTGHQFVLRVPPTMSTCRQAVAWTAGFDDPDAYRPAKET